MQRPEGPAENSRSQPLRARTRLPSDRPLEGQNHFFSPNDIKRYSIGTKNKTLRYNEDGSLTVYVQADPPAESQRGNWLPAPKDADFSLYVRTYWPQASITDGSWTPPAVQEAR